MGLILAIPAARSAQAAELTLISRTIYQGSQVRLYNDPSISLFRDLDRFAEWLEVGGYSFGPGDNFDAAVSLRYRTDFGTGFHRDTPDGLGIPSVDGRDQFELLYGYLDWRNAIQDRLDLRLGRQLQIDDLDWFSMDGLKLTGYLNRRNRLEVYVGRPVPYKSTLSSDPLLFDGTEIQDGTQLSVGGAGNFALGEDFSASLAFRQTYMFRGSNLLFPARPGFNEDTLVNSIESNTRGVSESVIGASLGYTLRPIHTDLSVHGVWNLLFGDLDRARANLSFTPIESVHVQLEYLRYQPRFVSDSIFNFFNIQPYDRGRLELGLEIIDGLWLEGGYFIHVTNGAPTANRGTADSGTLDTNANKNDGTVFKGDPIAHGPHLGLEYKASRFFLGAFVEASTNYSGSYAYGGNYRMVEGYGGLNFFEGRLQTSVRFNYTGEQTDWFKKIDSGQVAPEVSSYGLALSARGRIIDGISARLDFVKNFSAVLEGSYRLQSLLEIRYN
ncbi:MAG: hypothetical protein U1E65_14540 [Myxococcota bacterium]